MILVGRRRGVVGRHIVSEFERREALGDFGTYKPTLADVGWLDDPSITMTTINANVNMTTSGQVLENSIVNGFVDMRSSNQIVRNCIVRGPASNPSFLTRALISTAFSGTSNALIEDTTCNMQTPQSDCDGITGHDYTARRVHTKRTTDGFGVFNTSSPGSAVNVNIFGCYVEDMARFFPDATHDDGTHNDCIQIQGGSAIVIRGNYLNGYLSQDAGNTDGLNRQEPPFDTINSCIQFNNNVGNTSNVLIEDNWLYGAEIGMNGGSLTAAVNLGTIRDNNFGHDQTLTTPGTNTTYTININDTPTVSFSGNVYEDNGVAVQVRRPA